MKMKMKMKTKMKNKINWGPITFRNTIYKNFVCKCGGKLTKTCHMYYCLSCKKDYYQDRESGEIKQFKLN